MPLALGKLYFTILYFTCYAVVVCLRVDVKMFDRKLGKYQTVALRFGCAEWDRGGLFHLDGSLVGGNSKWN